MSATRAKKILGQRARFCDIIVSNPTAFEGWPMALRAGHKLMGGDGSKQTEPTPPPTETTPAPTPEPPSPEPVQENPPVKMSEPTAPPEAKEYPEFPGEKLSKR